MQPKKPLILFDLDGTLLDARSHIHQHLLASLEKKHGLSLAKLEKLKIDSYAFPHRGVGFQEKVFAQKIAAISDANVQEVLDLAYDEEVLRQFVFPDTVPVLEQLSGQYQLGIFSEGENWQRKKLDMSGLTKFFDEENTLIFREKTTPEVMAKALGSKLIVDDKLSKLEIFKDFFDAQPGSTKPHLVWIDRKKETTTADGIKRISSLKEIPQIVQVLD